MIEQVAQTDSCPFYVSNAPEIGGRRLEWAAIALVEGRDGRAGQSTQVGEGQSIASLDETMDSEMPEAVIQIRPAHVYGLEQLPVVGDERIELVRGWWRTEMKAWCHGEASSALIVAHIRFVDLI